MLNNQVICILIKVWGEGKGLGGHWTRLQFFFTYVTGTSLPVAGTHTLTTYVCRCVCIYVCMCIFMYVRMCLYVCTYVCVYVCIYACVYVVWIYLCMYVCVYVYVWMYVHVYYLCTYVCMHHKNHIFIKQSQYIT